MVRFRRNSKRSLLSYLLRGCKPDNVGTRSSENDFLLESLVHTQSRHCRGGTPVFICATLLGARPGHLRLAIGLALVILCLSIRAAQVTLRWRASSSKTSSRAFRRRCTSCRQKPGRHFASSLEQDPYL
jgi:hypothetical protein